MTPPELRITDRELWRARFHRCPDCAGLDAFAALRCFRCEGAGRLDLNLSPGASARLGAMLVERLPHLRHATWPPKRHRADRTTVATALAMIGAVWP